MTGPKIDLELDDATIKEIVKAVYRIFMLHTDNISVHFDEYAIHINVYPGRDTKFSLKDDPVDVRLNDREDRWDYVRRPRAY